RSLGEVRAPTVELLGGQVGELGVTEGRSDEGAIDIAHALDGPRRAPVGLQEADIGVNRIGDRADPAGALDQKLASSGLGLLKVEDDGAVGVAQIVGDANLVQAVATVTGIDPSQPLARAGARLAIAKMQEPGLERAVIGLATRIELAAGGAACERGGADGAGPGRSPPPVWHIPA